VPPRVRYGTTCLLIRKLYVVCHAQLIGDGTMLCDLSYFILSDLPEPHGAIGDVCVGNYSTACGDRLFGNCSKA
jgi:hypothetical protein